MERVIVTFSFRGAIAIHFKHMLAHSAELQFFGRIKWNGRSVQRAGSKLSRRYERCFDEDIWLLVRSRFAPWDAIAKEMDKLEQEASS